MDRAGPDDAGTGMRRILIVDDHRSFAEALALAVDQEPDLRTAGIAVDVREALDLVRREPPDVVLTDVRLPGVDGIEGIRMMREIAPEVPVVLFTGFADPSVLRRGVRAGAAGIISKQGSLADIVGAVRAAANGQMIVDRSTLVRLVAHREEEPEPAAPRAVSLTPREREVLGLLGDGMDPTAIARKLGISVHTARDHVKSILRKLDARSQLEAVILAMRSGLLERSG